MAEVQERIVKDPKILGGKPVIKGTRIPIHLILHMIDGGSSFEEILNDYPRLTLEDTKQ